MALTATKTVKIKVHGASQAEQFVFIDYLFESESLGAGTYFIYDPTVSEVASGSGSSDGSSTSGSSSSGSSDSGSTSGSSGSGSSGGSSTTPLTPSPAPENGGNTGAPGVEGVVDANPAVRPSAPLPLQFACAVTLLLFSRR
jgi:hypothetical protein